MLTGFCQLWDPNCIYNETIYLENRHLFIHENMLIYCVIKQNPRDKICELWHIFLCELAPQSDDNPHR